MGCLLSVFTGSVHAVPWFFSCLKGAGSVAIIRVGFIAVGTMPFARSPAPPAHPNGMKGQPSCCVRVMTSTLRSGVFPQLDGAFFMGDTGKLYTFLRIVLCENNKTKFSQMLFFSPFWAFMGLFFFGIRVIAPIMEIYTRIILNRSQLAMKWKSYQVVL